jgi:hypothetical protein
MASTAVSTAKVAVVDSGEVGRSAVFSRYNNGPRTLPCCIRKVLQPANSIKVFRGFPWSQNKC